MRASPLQTNSLGGSTVCHAGVQMLSVHGVRYRFAARYVIISVYAINISVTGTVDWILSIVCVRVGHDE